jgi:hypothetical protein
MGNAAAVATALPSDLIAALETNPVFVGRVIIGPIPPGDGTPIDLPLLSCWPLEPVRTGEGLAQEDAGQIHDLWQISCFGEDVAQALWARNQVIDGTVVWPTGWELDTVGPCLIDTDPAPVGWFAPVRYKFTLVA